MNGHIHKSRDLTKILDASHKNKWVAIDPSYSRVVAAAASLRELDKLVGGQYVIYYRVLPRETTFAPTIF